MFTRTLFQSILLSLAATGMFAAEPAAARQPVFIILYSRFYDHSQQHTTDERIQLLVPMLERWQKKHPDAGISSLFQFSGTVSQLLYEENSGLHLVDRLKEYSRQHLVEIGYTGENEPSYLYRPKPNLLEAETPDQRWAAYAEAAERFLVDFKDPITGRPVPGLTGGLKRTQEVFGDVAFVTGLTTTLGGDSPAQHQLRRMVPNAVTGGIPAADPRRGIEGFGASADNFSKIMSPDPVNSPEVFWQDGFLHLSDTSLADNRPHAADEGPEALKKVFDKLDRHHPRVIKLEIAAYKRYLTRRADGSVVADPLEWLYYHPDDPIIPLQMHAMVTPTELEKGYRADEATMRWLLEEFLPANPGSRFISVHELAQMAVPPEAEVSAAQLKAVAGNLMSTFARNPMQLPDYGKGDGRYYSLAESFELLAKALAGFDKSGSIPQTVALTPIYGPLTLPNNMGPSTGSVPVSAVVKAAAEVAPKLSDTEWKRVPSNAVPAEITVGTVQLNASQFLKLMAQAYLDPSPEKMLALNAMPLATRVMFWFPKNTPTTDQGNAWTFKPASLHTGMGEVSGTN